MPIDFLTQTFKQHLSDDAVIWHDKNYSYDWLMEKIEYWNFTLDNKIFRVEKHNLVYDMFFSAEVEKFGPVDFSAQAIKIVKT